MRALSEITPPKPVPLAPRFDAIPSALRASRSWVTWSYELRDDRWTKPPRRASDGGFAKTNNPATWADFETAQQAAAHNDGVGLVLTGDLVGVDLDHVLSPDTGEVEPWATEVLERFAGCYVERSPGGDGLRIFCRGTVHRSGKGSPTNRLEVYGKDSPRYLTVTGHRMREGEVIESQVALDWLHERFLAKAKQAKRLAAPSQHKPPVGASLAMDDADVIHRASNASNGAKFIALMAGHGGDDDSVNDAALVGLLAFWTQDVAQIDRIFRSSGLQREKWDERRGDTTYGRQTIERVLAMGGERFGVNQRPSVTRAAGVGATQGQEQEYALPHISEVQVWAQGAMSAVPEHLLRMPAPILEKIAEVMDQAAEDTDRAMTVLGVVHLASACVARRVISDMNNTAALYLCGVAKTGKGKNAPKNFVARALDRAFGQGAASAFSSDSGIFSLLSAAPAAVMHLDEFGDKLGHGLKDRAGSPMAKGFSFLKEVFSQAADRVSPAAFSLIGLTTRQRQDFADANKAVLMPHLNLLAVTTPGQLASAVTEASVEGGLVNRFLFVEACGRLQENKAFNPIPPDWVLDHMKRARTWKPVGVGNMESLDLCLPDQQPNLRTYTFDDGSAMALDAYKAEIRKLTANDEFMASMAQRWREIAMRMALALHAFASPEELIIDPRIVGWCIEYTRHYGLTFARKLLELATPTETYGRRRKAYLEAFRSRPRGVKTHDLGKYSPWQNDSPNMRAQLIADMVASGDIALVVGDKPPRGPSPRLYVALA